MLYAITKRLFDFLSASLGLIATSPLLVFLALCVKFTSRGPILYRGLRVGRNGKTFYLLKFRTMVPQAEQLGGSATSNDDVRLTSFGRVIRRYKLDELPQLWNVVRGEMSIVGPRPEVEKFVQKYSTEERRLLALRPGLTDWATIWNSDEGTALAGYKDPEGIYEQLIRPVKTELQLRYLEDHRWAIDSRILFQTAVKLFNKDWVPKELSDYGSSLDIKEGKQGSERAPI
jgi:lipopolysaccharide/colanic/teichoic acid biosynthesis glycosyltransferase